MRFALGAGAVARNAPLETAYPCCTTAWCAGRVVKNTPAAIAAATTGTSTSANLRRRGRSGACAAISRTRARRGGGASTRAVRSSASTSRCDMERLLELAQGAVQPRRAVGGRDAENAGGGAGVEIEEHAQRDDLALARAERAQRSFELGRQRLGEALVDALRRRGELLAAHAATLGAEVVECDGSRELAEPRARRSARGVEAVPQPQRAL